MPRIVQEPRSMMSSQKLSWSGGQWYFVRMRWRTTSVIVDAEEAIVSGASVCRFLFLARAEMCRGEGVGWKRCFLFSSRG